MGTLIDLRPHLEARRQAREDVETSPERLWRGESEIVSDLLEDLERARALGLCDTCGSDAAVAEVYRSDAVEAGLGAMYQCQTCLAGELRFRRSGTEARQIHWWIAHLMRERRGLVPVHITWDRRAERAVAVAGRPL